MGWVINCDCGTAIRGQTDDEIVENAQDREEQALVDGDAGAGAGPRREGVVSGWLGGLAPRQCAPPRFVVVGSQLRAH
jgi:hypothetical protein